MGPTEVESTSKHLIPNPEIRRQCMASYGLHIKDFMELWLFLEITNCPSSYFIQPY